jgi:hypothetical protein
MNNTMKSSSIFKFSYHSYSSAYELDYSFHIIIMIYELAYSLCVMILTCLTSCFNIHKTFLSRSRTRVEVMVRRSYGIAHILACLVVSGGMGSFLVYGHGAQVHGNLWI